MQSIIVGAVLLFIVILMMGIRVFFSKDGEFPNIHISNHDAMKERGIRCATSQDREARNRKTLLDKLEVKN